MEKASKILIDERGYKHKISISDLIGEGGQGKVFRSANKNILVKISNVNKPGDIKWNVNNIRSLNIPKNSNFALPLLSLEISNPNYEGYIMKIMKDMEPISLLMKSSFNNIEELYNYYDTTGGLKKRLSVLKNLAYNLYLLHSRGIVYGDISPNNIFVSTDPAQNETWFIDCDNISYNYDVNYTIGTPGFYSPEVRRALPPYFENKKNNTVENDIYSFAVLAFHTIFLADPFRGSILESEEIEEEDNWDDDFDSETKDKKFDLGEVSWIGEGDPSNNPIYGLSSQMNSILSREVMELFQKTLGEVGRKNPKSRASMRVWYEEIGILLNSLIECDCGHSYFIGNSSCLKCKKPKEEYLKFIIEYKGKKNNRVLVRTKVLEETTLTYGDLGIGKYGLKNEICLELYSRFRKNIIEHRMKNKINIIEKNELDGEDITSLESNKRGYFLKFEGLTINVVEEGIKIKIISEG